MFHYYSDCRLSDRRILVRNVEFLSIDQDTSCRMLLPIVLAALNIIVTDYQENPALVNWNATTEKSA